MTRQPTGLAASDLAEHVAVAKALTRETVARPIYEQIVRLEELVAKRADLARGCPIRVRRERPPAELQALLAADGGSDASARSAGWWSASGRNKPSC